MAVDARQQPQCASDIQNEKNVTVKYYRGQQSPVLNSSGFQRDVTYTIDPNTALKTLTTFKG